jgi:predicted PurR-regulated permease PerM
MKNHPLSWAALFRVVTVGLLIYLIWRLSGIIIISTLSLALAATLYPIVKFLNKKLSLTFSSIITIILIFLPLIIVITFLMKGFVTQLPEIISNFNYTIQSSNNIPQFIKDLDFTNYLQTGTQYLIKSTPKVTGFITAFLAVLFLTLYILIDSKRLVNMGINLIHRNQREKIGKLIDIIIDINAHYIRGNLLISLICTLIISGGLLLMGIPYAIVLGVFAGIVDLLPLVGAVIGAVPAVLIGLTISPAIGITVLVLFIVYQQFENHILAPNIYNKALDLSPALSFISVIIGATLFGIIGAFMSLPVAASIPAIIKYLDIEKAIEQK